MPRAGIVAVVGRPNAGKSTLLNRLVGQKLSITSAKPQSTRDRVVGIRTTADVQMIIADTPGLLDPRYALQRAMLATAQQALQDADVVLYLIDAGHAPQPPLAEAARLTRPLAGTVLTVLNKIDTLSDERREVLPQAMPGALEISALTGEGVDELLSAATAHLPEGHFLYPEDEIGTQSLRFFASEFIRETALEQLDDEVPYSVACQVEEFREGRSPVYIRAMIYVERESQKGILIGHRGARIREIGSEARRKLERFIDAPVYLDLRVKVLANWRKNAQALRRFGYTLPKE
jgi:GTP-binding protein Era